MSATDFLMQPMTLAALGVGAAGVGFIIIRSRGGGGGGDGDSPMLGGNKRKKYVVRLRNKDRMFKRINIVDETDEALVSKKEKNGITRFFAKRGGGWNDEDKAEAMYLGFSGYKYTVSVHDSTQGTDANGKIVLTPTQEVLKLSDAVRVVLGKEIYKLIDPSYVNKLEGAEWGITAEPIDPATTGATLVGNEARHTEADHEMIDYYAHKSAQELKGGMNWMQVLMGVAFGLIGGILLVSFKVIKLA
jgi:hypothetical protein